MEFLKKWVAEASVPSRFLTCILLLMVGALLIRIIMSIIKRALRKSKLEKAAHSLIRSLVRTVLYLLLGLILASSLGIDVTGIIALASVLSLAVSLSVQNLLTNIIGGFTLLYTKPFKSGDYVEIASQAGTVREIGMTYTKLSTSDNKIVYIPNNAVVSAEITNYSVTGTRRVEVTVGVSYDCPAEQTIAALLEAAKVPGVRKDPAPFAAVANFGDSTVTYTLRVWTASDDFWSVKFAIHQNIPKVFKEMGVEMSYPHLNIHVEK